MVMCTQTTCNNDSMYKIFQSLDKYENNSKGGQKSVKQCTDEVESALSLETQTFTFSLEVWLYFMQNWLMGCG